MELQNRTKETPQKITIITKEYHYEKIYTLENFDMRPLVSTTEDKDDYGYNIDMFIKYEKSLFDRDGDLDESKLLRNYEVKSNIEREFRKLNNSSFKKYEFPIIDGYEDYYILPEKMLNLNFNDFPRDVLEEHHYIWIAVEWVFIKPKPKNKKEEQISFEEWKLEHKIEYEQFEEWRKKNMEEVKDNQVIDDISKMNLEK
jgi:hypothetical protein